MSIGRFTSRAEQVRDAVRARITSGEWALHSRIPGEMALTEEFEVSRGTVREAIRALASLGLLEAVAGRGTFVRSRVPTDSALMALLRERGPEECLELRAAIEGEAARTLAARNYLAAVARVETVSRGDEGREYTPGEFHARLVEEGSAELTVSVHASLMQAVWFFLAVGKLRHALDELARDHDHAAIIAAIRAGDAPVAATLASAHARTDLVPA